MSPWRSVGLLWSLRTSPPVSISPPVLSVGTAACHCLSVCPRFSLQLYSSQEKFVAKRVFSFSSYFSLQKKREARRKVCPFFFFFPPLQFLAVIKEEDYQKQLLTSRNILPSLSSPSKHYGLQAKGRRGRFAERMVSLRLMGLLSFSP